MGRRAQPRISRQQAERAIDNVIARRMRYEDRHREKLSDHPVELARYVADHHKVPKQMLAADVVDALTALEYAHHAVPAIPSTLEALEGRLLLLGLQAEVHLSELGRPLGIPTRQATWRRVKRHWAASMGFPRTEPGVRRARAAQQWTTETGSRFLEAVRDMLAFTDDLIANGSDPEDLAGIAGSLAAAEAVSTTDDVERWTRFNVLASRVGLLQKLEDPPGHPSELLAAWGAVAGLVAQYDKIRPAADDAHDSAETEAQLAAFKASAES